MPIETFISPDFDLMVSRWRGVVDAKARYEAFADYIGDPAYRMGRPELIDLNGANLVEWDIGRVQHFLHQVNEFNKGNPVPTRVVVWAPEDDAFGSTRMYQTLADMAGGIRVEVFRDERVALSAQGFDYSSIDALVATRTFRRVTPLKAALPEPRPVSGPAPAPPRRIAQTLHPPLLH